MATLIELWVPVVVFAHLFTGFWFFRLALSYNPRFFASFRRKRASTTGLPNRVSEGGENRTVEEVLESDKKPAAGNKAADGIKKGAECMGPAQSKVERAHLEWQQLSCIYNTANGKIVVLDNIWGRASPGEMQALLGPSGAGKSTLMDILAQRKSVGNLSGFLLVNGRPATSSFIRKTAYVPQDDNFVATMTVSETLSFYADIILPQNWAKVDRKARVAEVLAAMGLKHRQMSLVGGSLPGGLMLRGLSGGERKRLSIAAGIMSTPSIVLLDEPTSGLDSFAALTVMGYLKRMAQENGHVIIASIHQPRSAIWSMFDTVTLLSTGRLMFHGARDDLVPWFGHLGYNYDPSLHGVASDWALDLVAIGFHKPKRFYGHTITNAEELTRASNDFVSSYTSLSGVIPFAGDSSSMIGSKSLGQKMQARVHKVVGIKTSVSGSTLVHRVSVSAGSNSSRNSATGSLDGEVTDFPQIVQDSGRDKKKKRPSADDLKPAQQSKWSTSWWRHFTSCYGREVLVITRNPADVAGRTMTFAWVAILMGILYYNMPDDATSIRGRLNMAFNNLVFFCLMPYVSMSLFCADKKFYVADASAKLYRSHAYYVAKVLAITPFQVISALVFCFTVYGMTGLRPGARFILENGTISALLQLIAVQVLHCCAILAPNQDVAFMYSIVWTAINLFMSDFFILFSEVELYGITHLRWLSALYYSFEGIMITEFRGMKFTCNGGLGDSGIKALRNLLPGNKFLNMPVVVNGLKNPGGDCVANADAVLDYYGFSRPFSHTFGILFSYLIIVHIGTYVSMLFVARRERR